MLTCPRCGESPRTEFRMVVPDVACGQGSRDAVEVLRHKRCGRLVYVPVEMRKQVR